MIDIVYNIEKNQKIKTITDTEKKNQVMLSICVIILLTLAAHFPTFFHQFQLKWDDQWVVINAYTEGGLTLSNLKSILTEFYNGQYSPINQFSYTLLFSIFGYSAFWFHCFSIAIHVCNVVLIYLLIRNLLKQAKKFEDISIQRIAISTAILMAVHPFLVESVAWLSASKILLYSFFYLLAIHVYLAYLNTRLLSYYLLTIFLFTLSFGSKEQAVTLPVCLLLIDFILKRNFGTKQLWLEKLPLFLMAICFGYITLLSQSADNAGLLSESPQYPLYQNILFASYSVTEYLIKCLIPIKLSYLYVFPNSIGQEVPLRFWLYPILLTTIIIAFWSFLKNRYVFFAVAFFVIHLGLALHIIPIARFAIIADRYAYIASISVFVLMSYYFDLLYSKTKYTQLALAIGTLYVISIGTYAHEHSKVWSNSDTLKKELRSLFKDRNNFHKNTSVK